LKSGDSECFRSLKIVYRLFVPQIKRFRRDEENGPSAIQITGTISAEQEEEFPLHFGCSIRIGEIETLNVNFSTLGLLGLLQKTTPRQKI
jgi:hypothetical protein